MPSKHKRPMGHNAHLCQLIRWFTHHSLFITKTCLYNIDPLKPHFYTVKLGFTGVYIIFFISAQKHRLWVLGNSNEYPQSMFWAEIWKLSDFLSENFQFLEVKFCIYLYRRVFVMSPSSFKAMKQFLRHLAYKVKMLNVLKGHKFRS